jgi:Flp pilus assembly protein TadD
MKHIILMVAALFTLSACEEGSIGKQWLDPDKEFKEFDQPDVPTQRSLMEQGAKDALEKGNALKAAQIYKQLAEQPKLKDPEKRSYMVQFADATRRSGEYEKALKLFDDLSKKQKPSAELLEGKGLCLMGMGKMQEAGRVFKEVMTLDKQRWRTLNALGILFATRNMIPESMAYYAEALRVSEDNPAILNNVGLSQAIARNYPRAIQAMEQAVRVAPNDLRREQIELNFALIQGIKGDLDGAKAIASKYLKGPALDNNLGLYAYLSDNKELAKTYLNQALTNSTTYYERAWQNLDLVSESGKGDALKPATH